MKKDPPWLERLKEEVFLRETQQWLFRSEHPIFAIDPPYERRLPFSVMHDWWVRHVQFYGMPYIT
jgi:hypothetical protein